jgi:hypothetical protein
MGETEDAAMTDAAMYDSETTALGDMVIVEITAEQAARIEQGVVEISALGIELTRSQIRALAGS